MSLRTVFATMLAAALMLCNLMQTQAADLPPDVIDLMITAGGSADIINATITTTNNPESWSVPVGPWYTPGYGALPSAAGMLIPPSWNATTHTLVWDSAGSTGGTYFWTVTASNSAGSDSGTITTNIFGGEWYGGKVPIFDHLKFSMQSPISNGGVVTGKITATENPDDWSELLYPSYKTQQYGPVSAPSGIQTPNWNPTNQEFSWNMQGAIAGIYTWYVKARSYDGYIGAGAIEVTILVPEPNSILLAMLGLFTLVSPVRRRST